MIIVAEKTELDVLEEGCLPWIFGRRAICDEFVLSKKETENRNLVMYPIDYPVP